MEKLRTDMEQHFPRGENTICDSMRILADPITHRHDWNYEMWFRLWGRSFMGAAATTYKIEESMARAEKSQPATTRSANIL